MADNEECYLLPPGKLGGGVQPGSLRGCVFKLNETPECHQHCDCCMDTICPCPEHHPMYSVGYVATITEGTDNWQYWLCPDCYSWLLKAGELS